MEIVFLVQIWRQWLFSLFSSYYKAFHRVIVSCILSYDIPICLATFTFSENFSNFLRISQIDIPIPMSLSVDPYRYIPMPMYMDRACQFQLRASSAHYSRRQLVLEDQLKSGPEMTRIEHLSDLHYPDADPPCHFCSNQSSLSIHDSNRLKIVSGGTVLIFYFISKLIY